MIRDHLPRQLFGAEKDFHWRGEDITRIETFSDSVFAFAVTLLVVSLQVPRTYSELTTALEGLAGFGISFLLLSLVWRNHCIYFRRFGLYDNITTVLNILLLFIVLAYVYPLKFLFNLLTDQILGLGTNVQLSNGQVQPMIYDWQLPGLMIIYGIGYAAVSLCFMTMHIHAYSKRESLRLDQIERLITRGEIRENILLASVGFLSIGLAIFHQAGLAGLAYILIMPIATINGRVVKKCTQQMQNGTT